MQRVSHEKLIGGLISFGSSDTPPPSWIMKVGSLPKQAFCAREPRELRDFSAMSLRDGTACPVLKKRARVRELDGMSRAGAARGLPRCLGCSGDGRFAWRGVGFFLGQAPRGLGEGGVGPT